MQRYAVSIVLTMAAVMALSACPKPSQPTDEPRRSTEPSVPDAPQMSAIVTQLKDLLQRRPDLSAALTQALAEQQADSFWHGKTPDDFYAFVEAWRTFTPGVEGSSQFSERVRQLYAKPKRGGDIAAGIQLFQDAAFRTWMQAFMRMREEFLDSPASTTTLKQWLANTKIDMDDFHVPAAGYQSFNEFFTRRLRDGARPIHQPDSNATLTSPADCLVWEGPKPLAADSTLAVKGEQMDLAALLEDADAAKRFHGGRAIICFLQLKDYHRFHAPVSGKVVAARQVGGLYFGINGFAPTFHERRRGVYLIETQDAGMVALVSVGLASISSIALIRQPGEQIRKGDELGNFAYGGSTIVMLFESERLQTLIEPDAKTSHPTIRWSTVRMGQHIGTLKLQ